MLEIAFDWAFLLLFENYLLQLAGMLPVMEILTEISDINTDTPSV